MTSNIKKSAILISLLYTLSSFSQFGYSVETNISSIKTDDFFDIRSKSGFGLGVVSHEPIYNTGDLLWEFSYTKENVMLGGYVDFYGNQLLFDESLKYSTDEINFNILINQYIIKPDNKKINLSVQLGIGGGLVLSNTEKYNNYDYFSFNIPPYGFYSIYGISTGTEKLRFSLRYTKTLGNFLKEINVDEIANVGDLYDSKEYYGKQSCIILSIIYFANIFGE